MAKNLFEQLLTKAGEIWSGSKSHGDHQMYIQDSTGLSGVAKYLAKQEQAAKPQEENKASQASGVEKYLARQQASSPTPVSAAATPTTGVGKYLARQTSSATPPPKPVVVPKTGVGKYLAGVSLASESKAASVPEKKQPQPKKAEKSKAPTQAKKPAPATPVSDATPAAASKAPATEAKAAAVTAPAPTSGIIRFENITQCHASTVKGTQCKNTTNLTKIQRTVNKKKYQFCACIQHNNDSFKPYAPLLETH